MWRNDGVHCLVLKLLLTSTFNPVFHIHLSVGEPFYVSVSLPSISRSVSVCKLQRQHHMATDSFHTFPLCSIKLLNPCQSLRAEREREPGSSASRAPICLQQCAVFLVSVSVRFKCLLSKAFMSFLPLVVEWAPSDIRCAVYCI